VEVLLGSGQFGAALFHLSTTAQRRYEPRARRGQNGVR
jgi:hypothetical protein